MAKRILLVEDDVFIKDMYIKVLQNAGYEIISAGDGEEGLQKAQDGKYDIILLDIMLPKMTGIDLLKQIKSETATEELKNTPVYLLTNLGDDAVIKEAFKIGASGYLLKAKYLPQQIVSEIESFFLNGDNSF